MRNTIILGALASTALLLAGCETTGIRMGDAGAKTVATGSAAGSASTNASGELERCAAPLGTISLVENQSAGWYTILRNEYRLPPTANLLRLLVQQSNCFVVVERSAAGMDAMNRERALMQGGEMRAGSNFGRGQVVASDYALSPEIIFSSDNTGGIAGALGGLIGGGSGRALAAVGANTQTRQASAMLTLVDNRSGVQVSASEGSASKTDIGGFGALLGGSAGGGLGGYSRTPQGKLIAAAFMDAYNQMVLSLREYRAQSVQGQGLGGGGRLGVDGGAAPSQTYAGSQGPRMTLRKAQQVLNELGYDAGTADGKMGQRTATALREFQDDQGLPVTGRLDPATSAALGNQ
ncbi:peptidoglycan-binding protein [Corticibacter populi]|uniref:Peptidoglycan-binding protein n=1 Tax=Corticibacter populi TaxID=1550736 RepID=A0A3M6QSJ4_9BURK|nr:peptidoglycan-binding protein [Corticibacter populi]RMX06004.1 peptidoglycan-binding protein [Corticibacter populi]RZS30663.1 curli biogenesis system outer membrane secretion channel CsgG [Corticibacter populi]